MPGVIPCTVTPGPRVFPDAGQPCSRRPEPQSSRWSWGSPCWWRGVLLRPIPAGASSCSPPKAARPGWASRPSSRSSVNTRFPRTRKPTPWWTQVGRRIADCRPTPRLPLGICGLRRQGGQRLLSARGQGRHLHRHPEIYPGRGRHGHGDLPRSGPRPGPPRRGAHEPIHAGPGRGPGAGGGAGRGGRPSPARPSCRATAWAPNWASSCPTAGAQEYEADHIGLILMAKAGYDPAQALEFWKRMMTDEKGAKLPQFMSTHPSDASRLKELEAFLPEARKYYVPAPEAQGQPPPPAAAPAAPAPGQWIPAPDNPRFLLQWHRPPACDQHRLEARTTSEPRRAAGPHFLWKIVKSRGTGASRCRLRSERYRRVTARRQAPRARPWPPGFPWPWPRPL